MTGAKVAIHEADALSLSGERELKKVSGILSMALLQKPVFNILPLGP
jgi:hypothetical protein